MGRGGLRAAGGDGSADKCGMTTACPGVLPACGSHPALLRQAAPREAAGLAAGDGAVPPMRGRIKCSISVFPKEGGTGEAP